mgnify:CR=1
MWYNIKCAGRPASIPKGSEVVAVDHTYKSEVIFRAWRKDPRTGKILYARNYGLRAWPIPVSELKENSNDSQSRTPAE